MMMRRAQTFFRLGWIENAPLGERVDRMVSDVEPWVEAIRGLERPSTNTLMRMGS